MTIIHIISIGLSIGVAMIGFSGFVWKKWNIWKAYVFFWLAPSLFGFGILPTQFPDWSLLRQVIYIIALSVLSFIVVGSMLKYLLVKKGKR